MRRGSRDPRCHGVIRKRRIDSVSRHARPPEADTTLLLLQLSPLATPLPPAHTPPRRPPLTSYAPSSPARVQPVRTPSWPPKPKPRTSSTTTPLVSGDSSSRHSCRIADRPPCAAVFSKSYCPYCKATKSLLSEAGAKPYILELDQIGRFPAHSVHSLGHH